MSTTIDLDRADVAWLEAYYGARNARLIDAQRTVHTARCHMVGEGLGVSVSAMTLGNRVITAETSDVLDTETLIRVLGAHLRFDGGDYLFDTLEAQDEHVTEWGADYTRSWIAITYTRR